MDSNGRNAELIPSRSPCLIRLLKTERESTAQSSPDSSPQKSKLRRSNCKIPQSMPLANLPTWTISIHNDELGSCENTISRTTASLQLKQAIMNIKINRSQ